MKHYERKISLLGGSIRTIKKHRGMKQRELMDRIGINMQSFSKIECGVNYPTFDTLKKVMDVLGVTPSELLSGKQGYIDHIKPHTTGIIKRKQDLGVSLGHLPENEFLDDEKECTSCEAYKLVQYIHNYIASEITKLEEFMKIKQLV